MIRFLIFSFCLFFSLNAEALVKQSVSQALSYRNVVSGVSVSEPEEKVLDVPSTPAPRPVEDEKIEEVDLRTSSSKTVSLGNKGKVLIRLPEESGSRWKVSYNNSNVIMVSNVVKSSTREVMFMKKRTGGSTIFFDKTNSQGDVVTNKAVYIKDSL